jgi:steroid Delta-isomerase
MGTMREIVADVTARYFAASREMDLDAWTDLFADDAVSEDPVGEPPNVGKAAIRQLLAGILGLFTKIGLFEDNVFIAGSSAAVKWTARGVGKNGRAVTFEGVDVMDVNAGGKIQSVRAYWDPAPLKAILSEAPQAPASPG